MSKYQLPDNIVNDVKDGMKDASGVKLPFPAPVMWWMNGNTAFKDESTIVDARRFGGFGISKEDLDEQGIQPAQSWQLHKLTNAKGKSYEAYLCRTAWVAPIARRFAWFENEGKWRTSLNILCMLYLKNQQGELRKYGAVVLSAKSYTGSDLDAAFKKFTAQTAALRDGSPSQFFVHGIGTFGKEPQFRDAKGKGGQESSITPPQLAVPSAGYSDEYMDKHFVGQEVAAEMAKIAKDAREWLDDWNKRGKNQNASQDTASEANAAMQEVEYRDEPEF